MTAASPRSPAADRPPAWGVACAIDTGIRLPAGDVIDGGLFPELLWAVWGDSGLVAIDEGAVDVGEARALGLVDASRVVDVAAAPRDRDWVGGRRAGSVTGWFVDEATAREAAAWLAELHGCEVLDVHPAAGADERQWRGSFARIELPGFGVILPAWEPGVAGCGPDGATLFIEPGVGFGTGLHATTQLCLESLSAWVAAGGSVERVLDFGSGSGILGIAAAVLGATRVDCVEIDPQVHAAIRSNAARNGVADRVSVCESLAEAAGDHDLALANIVADVLVEQAEPLCRGLGRASGRAGGRTALRPTRGGLVISGLMAEDVPRVAACFAGIRGLQPSVTMRDEWCCLRFGAVWNRLAG